MSLARLLYTFCLSFLHKKLASVNTHQQQEHGQEQGTEYDTDESEQLQSHNDTEYGDQGVDIAQLFIDHKTEQVINKPDQPETPYAHGYRLPGFTLGKQHNRKRYIHQGGTHHGH